MSKLQPANVSWNRPFKAKIAEMYGPVDKTPNGYRRAVLKALVLRWIKDARYSITPDSIRRSFKKCGIMCALDGTEDHLFNDQSDQDTVQTEFEEFSDDEIEVSEMVMAAAESAVETVLSESEVDFDHEEDSTDYDSDGH